MTSRLRNDTNTMQTIRISSRTWRSTLDLAGRHGWLPMGTVRPEMLTGTIYGSVEDHSEDGARLASGVALGAYTPHTDRMVLLEDALNLADALERAFIEYDPARVNPDRYLLASDWDTGPDENRPGIGLMLTLVDFFRRGAFWIERC